LQPIRPKAAQQYYVTAADIGSRNAQAKAASAFNPDSYRDGCAFFTFFAQAKKVDYGQRPTATGIL
jgi:hypothetical protein